MHIFLPRTFVNEHLQGGVHHIRTTTNIYSYVQ